MEATWRQGIPPRQRPRKTTFGCALNAQRISATFKDRLTCVKGRVWGTMGKEKGRLKTLSSILKVEGADVELNGDGR
jgi:hypothetical protein